MDFLTGAASAFSLAGNFYEFEPASNPEEADKEAIRSDFEAISKDFQANEENQHSK